MPVLKNYGYNFALDLFIVDVNKLGTWLSDEINEKKVTKINLKCIGIKNEKKKKRLQNALKTGCTWIARSWHVNRTVGYTVTHSKTTVACQSPIQTGWSSVVTRNLRLIAQSCLWNAWWHVKPPHSHIGCTVSTPSDRFSFQRLFFWEI